jgi:hypothetical protein
MALDVFNFCHLYESKSSVIICKALLILVAVGVCNMLRVSDVILKLFAYCLYLYLMGLSVTVEFRI